MWTLYYNKIAFSEVMLKNITRKCSNFDGLCNIIGSILKLL